ncbi:MAG: universal stress protein, partial [Actinomycetota bacterium]
AARHARRRGAHLDVVLAWQSPAGAVTPMGMAYVPPPIETIRADAERRLDRSLESCDLTDVEFEPIVVERDAATLLCETAADADLLVVGSRGLGGFKGLILGSVSARCANECPCPVAIVPSEWEDPGRDVHGVVSIGVDGSANADAAVRWADSWAPDDSLLRLVCAWTVAAPYDRVVPEVDEVRMREIAEHTAERAGELVVGHDHVADAVRLDARLALAHEASLADVVVVGARGHRGLSRLLLGSVASAVVHHVQVPTVVVPTPDESD